MSAVRELLLLLLHLQWFAYFLGAFLPLLLACCVGLAALLCVLIYLPACDCCYDSAIDLIGVVRNNVAREVPE